MKNNNFVLCDMWDIYTEDQDIFLRKLIKKNVNRKFVKLSVMTCRTNMLCYIDFSFDEESSLKMYNCTR